MNKKETNTESTNFCQELTEIEKMVTKILEDISLIPVNDFKMQLINDLGFDSLRLVMLLITLEESFEFELDESDMNPFVLITAKDVVELVNRYVEGKRHE